MSKKVLSYLFLSNEYTIKACTLRCKKPLRNAKSSTFHVKSSTIDVKSSTIGIESRAFNINSGAIDIKSCTIDIESWAFYVNSSTCDVKSSTHEVESLLHRGDTDFFEVLWQPIDIRNGVANCAIYLYVVFVGKVAACGLYEGLTFCFDGTERRI